MPQTPQALYMPEEMLQAPTTGVLRLMFYSHTGNWHKAIPLQLKTQTDIHILAIHEVTTIKAPEFIKNSNGKKHRLLITCAARGLSATLAMMKPSARKTSPPRLSITNSNTSEPAICK